MFELRQQIEEAVKVIRQKTELKPKVAITLGTGMGALGDKLEDLVKIPYRQIPHFPISTVETHAGYLCFGDLEENPTVVMQGRFHLYEGYTMKQVTFPIRVMKALGATHLIIMNATGSMNPHIPAGSLVLVTDHINLMGDNPLIGPNDDTLGPRFPDMSEPYHGELIALAEEVARKEDIALHKGVFVAVAGPNLETRAEYRFLRFIGADVVGMSTVPEVIVAVHCGLRVLGFSVITDMCFPDALQPADIDEIIANANAAEPKLTTLILGVLAREKAISSADKLT